MCGTGKYLGDPANDETLQTPAGGIYGMRSLQIRMLSCSLSEPFNPNFKALFNFSSITNEPSNAQQAIPFHVPPQVFQHGNIADDFRSPILAACQALELDFAVDFAQSDGA